MKKLITLFFVLCVGAFASSATAGVGDVNADGDVNVSDVTALVNQIIGSGSYSASSRRWSGRSASGSRMLSVRWTIQG